ncbi:unnamed protein product [Urochloa humidicola]
MKNIYKLETRYSYGLIQIHLVHETNNTTQYNKTFRRECMPCESLINASSHPTHTSLSLHASVKKHEGVFIKPR